MRERDFIAHLLATQAAAGESIELDAGDDMAVVRAPECRVLAAIDAVVEGRHFRAGTDPFLIGRKAVLRNVSDVAAMAAQGLAAEQEQGEHRHDGGEAGDEGPVEGLVHRPVDDVLVPRVAHERHVLADAVEHHHHVI